MTDLFTALALAMVVEGIAYALFPDGMKRMMLQALAMPPQHLRLVGLGAAAVGVLAVALLRHAGHAL